MGLLVLDLGGVHGLPPPRMFARDEVRGCGTGLIATAAICSPSLELLRFCRRRGSQHAMTIDLDYGPLDLLVLHLLC